MRMAAGLVLVVLAILACAWLARRAGLAPASSRRTLREVDGLRMGPRHRVSVLEIDGKWLVVGVSAGQMTLLHAQDAPASSSEPQSPDLATEGPVSAAGAPVVARVGRGNFAAILAHARDRRWTMRNDR